MNARPMPHIGATLAQRAILRYQMEQRELEAERARFERTTAALQVDALLDRVRQPEPCNFCAPDEVLEPVPRWILVLGAALWSAVVIVGLVLMAARLGWLS